ncbi:MAG: hypothetical protein H6587_11310 [Flavobacteriales bacterium]|nr:hypothetical protein [Flavobacteriales bacterium]MCB9365148.1 hypothetical protein [Flavobacteriales bacterium]
MNTKQATSVFLLFCLLIIPMASIFGQGSCGSPDAPVHEYASAPTSYFSMNLNGDCYSGYSGSSVTACWTFTPSSSSVSLYIAYSLSFGCSVASATYVLYDASCSPVTSGNIGGGMITGLSVGQQYTWCTTITSNSSSCNFTKFCPAYVNESTLPVNLLAFGGDVKNNVNTLTWETANEVNNDYFVLERSNDGEYWQKVAVVQGGGSTNITSFYQFDDQNFQKKAINYYRLTQVDFNGMQKIIGLINLDNRKNSSKEIIERYNLFGQKVDDKYEGITLLIYDDGSKEKIYQNK